MHVKCLLLSQKCPLVFFFKYRKTNLNFQTSNLVVWWAPTRLYLSEVLGFILDLDFSIGELNVIYCCPEVYRGAKVMKHWSWK